MGAAINAAETVTFFRRKPAHLLMPGRKHCGRVRVADIGIDPGVLGSPAAYVENVRERRILPLPTSTATNMPAAMRSCCRVHWLDRRCAARRAGRAAGRGRAGHRGVAARRPRGQAAALTAVMVRAVDTAVEFAEMLDDRRLNSLVIGPGAGVSARTRDLVHTALSAKRGLVLDADALTSFAEAPERLFE